MTMPPRAEVLGRLGLELCMCKDERRQHAVEGGVASWGKDPKRWRWGRCLRAMCPCVRFKLAPRSRQQLELFS